MQDVVVEQRLEEHAPIRAVAVGNAARHLRHRLLEGGAEILDQRRLDIRHFPPVEQPRHLNGHAPDRQMRPTSLPMASAAYRSGFGPAARTISTISRKVDRNRSGPLRSKASSEITCCQPPPTSPTTASSATKWSSKTTSLKWWSPARL